MGGLCECTLIENTTTAAPERGARDSNAVPITLVGTRMRVRVCNLKRWERAGARASEGSWRMSVSVSAARRSAWVAKCRPTTVKAGVNGGCVSDRESVDTLIAAGMRFLRK